jgi:hypothetical protein
VLDRYFAHTKILVNEALNDKSLTGRQRLRRYLDIITGILKGAKWSRGCLIGDFSLEASSQSKLLRKRLEAIFREWRIPFAKYIAEAQAAGEIDSRFDAAELAEFLLASWEGAILGMKVERGRPHSNASKRSCLKPYLRSRNDRNIRHHVTSTYRFEFYHGIPGVRRSRRAYGAVFTREPDIVVYLAKRDSVGCADSALYRAGSHRVRTIR